MSKTPVVSFDRLVDDLAYRFEATFTRGEIVEAVERARRELEPTSRHPEFLTVLVEKAAVAHLTSLARRRGTGAAPTPELLFVCLHNEGRSQMAAAIAEHLAGGRVHVRSAGAHPTGLLNPTVVAALAERGITLDHAYPTPADDDVLAAADIVVAMGPDLPAMGGRHQLRWDIEDPHHKGLDVVRRIRDDIEARVAALLADLGIHTEEPHAPTLAHAAA